MNDMACEPSLWGGQWTEEKLDAFEKYVNAYLTIMNAFRDKYGWKLLYFDGFAGSGSRNDKKAGEGASLLQDFFHESFIQVEELNLYKGAAERVLSIPQRGFDYYYFVDNDEESSTLLRQKLSPYMANHRLEFRISDANIEVGKLAAAMRKNKDLATLALLDPFGMQVRWDSISQLKDTRTDLWILIPTGVIVNRLLDRKGNLVHLEKLISFFGKDEDYLRSYFFQKRKEQTLFGEIEIVEKVKTANSKNC